MFGFLPVWPDFSDPWTSTGRSNPRNYCSLHIVFHFGLMVVMWWKSLETRAARLAPITTIATFKVNKNPLSSQILMLALSFSAVVVTTSMRPHALNHSRVTGLSAAGVYIKNAFKKRLAESEHSSLHQRFCCSQNTLAFNIPSCPEIKRRAWAAVTFKRSLRFQRRQVAAPVRTNLPFSLQRNWWARY